MPNRHSTLNSLFTDIATAIRNKKGESSSITYKADDFDTAIASIPVGGDYNVISTENPDGSQNLAITDAAGGGGIESLTVTTHGTYTKSSGGYNPVIVEDANLAAGNIKKDVSIFGVTGTFEGGGSSVVIHVSDVEPTAEEGSNGDLWLVV